MNPLICVDASLVIKLFLEEENSDKADLRWSTWLASGVELIAPCHLAFETISVIRRRVYHQKLDAVSGRLAFEAFQQQPIRLVHPNSLYERAWQMAQRFNRPTVYDAFYLAVGDLYQCEFWTADRRLHKAVELDLPWVKLIDYYEPDQATRPNQELL